MDAEGISLFMTGAGAFSSGANIGGPLSGPELSFWSKDRVEAKSRLNRGG